MTVVAKTSLKYIPLEGIATVDTFGGCYVLRNMVNILRASTVCSTPRGHTITKDVQAIFELALTRAFIFYYVFYTKSRKYTLQVKTMQFTLCILHYVFYTLKNHVLFPGQSEQRILH